jgi:hypothetical protein
MTSKSKYDYSALFMTFFTITLYSGGFIFALWDSTQSNFILALLFVVILVLLILDFSLLHWDTNHIVFDPNGPSITFKQIVTNKENVYFFKDFDGVLESKQAWAGGRGGHKILYLVKDNKIIERISSVFIKNYDEIDAFLKTNYVLRLTKDNNSLFFDVLELFGKPSIKKS